MTPSQLNKLSNRGLGIWGEEFAVKYLKKNHYEIVATNWRNSRKGELDIIAKFGGVLVFVEVKTRRTIRTGRPLEAIEHRKYQQIRSLISAYLSEIDENYESIRVDVIGIIALSKEIKLKHIKGVRIW